MSHVCKYRYQSSRVISLAVLPDPVDNCTMRKKRWFFAYPGSVCYHGFVGAEHMQVASACAMWKKCGACAFNSIP